MEQTARIALLGAVAARMVYHRPVGSTCLYFPDDTAIDVTDLVNSLYDDGLVFNDTDHYWELTEQGRHELASTVKEIG